ncbi:MAG: metallophosphoesterase [Pseudohongiellaceae bacterium]
MRIFAISDLHVDYPENLDWIESAIDQSCQHDLLILAGDVSDDLALLRRIFLFLTRKFLKVLFVPGNHELWLRDGSEDCSLRKFASVRKLCNETGVIDSLYVHGHITFVPLFSWYDYSFAEPDRHLQRAWRDFGACRWPPEMQTCADINRYFLNLNLPLLDSTNELVISYSHFLPRIDLMPARIPPKKRKVYPVLGSNALGHQVRRLRPDIHVYGHSHVNRAVTLDGIRFINNAYGYPGEDRIARKHLFCIYDDSYPVATGQTAAGGGSA